MKRGIFFLVALCLGGISAARENSGVRLLRPRNVVTHEPSSTPPPPIKMQLHEPSPVTTPTRERSPSSLTLQAPVKDVKPLMEMVRQFSDQQLLKLFNQLPTPNAKLKTDYFKSMGELNPQEEVQEIPTYGNSTYLIPRIEDKLNRLIDSDNLWVQATQIIQDLASKKPKKK